MRNQTRQQSQVGLVVEALSEGFLTDCLTGLHRCRADTRGPSGPENPLNHTYL